MVTDYPRARRYLMRKDPVLGAIIKRVGPCGLPDLPDQPAFMALAEAIASQQLSVKAADTIFGRFCALFPPDNVPDPARLLALDDTAVRGAGFSRAKVLFLKDLAAHILDRRLLVDDLQALDDERVLEQLTAVKGIGVWTAEIFLMFRLRRPDIFPVDDLGLVRAMAQAYRLRQPPTRQKLLAMAEAWRPYRSIAAWYLWRSLTLAPAPVKAAAPRTSTPKRTASTSARTPARRRPATRKTT